jgi:hypothetical protein
MTEQRCTHAFAAGRLTKAREFRLAAELVATSDSGGELADAYITMCVHAGIAAADAICRRLSVHHKGESHDAAVQLLRRVDRQLAADLAVLLRQKTASGYGATPSSPADRRQAKRATQRLVEAAEAVGIGR